MKSLLFFQIFQAYLVVFVQNVYVCLKLLFLLHQLIFSLHDTHWLLLKLGKHHWSVDHFFDLGVETLLLLLNFLLFLIYFFLSNQLRILLFLLINLLITLFFQFYDLFNKVLNHWFLDEFAGIDWARLNWLCILLIFLVVWWVALKNRWFVRLRVIDTVNLNN